MTHRRSDGRQLAAALVVVVIALAAVLLTHTSSSAAPKPRRVESIFQDDDHLLYASTPVVRGTLDVLRVLGVDRLRVTVLWRYIAPDPASRTPPPNFNAGDPAAYPAAVWTPYDRLVRMAQARGIRIDFDLTAPGPLWAMAQHPPSARYADHWAASPQAFELFVQAVGRRYSGHFRPPGATALPRVGFWSVWNEPNQPGWLAPQWQSTGGGPVLEAPALYRAYVDAAWNGLERSGHLPSRDTILIGELAPEGSEGPTFTYSSATPPLPFLRALYCVDGADHPLRGGAAARLGCPQNASRSAFVAAHPGLFEASGFAHHPYSFFLAPQVSMADRNFVPLSDLARLERALDAISAAYGVGRRLPLWLTEYGYETNPPNPFRGVSLRAQSRYLNEAQYMAFRDPRVRGFAQFLLFDARPDPRYPPGTPRYWSTFQTGLAFADGAPKPSFNSYRLPLYLPDPFLSRGGRVLVWALLRSAPSNTRQVARIEWRPQAGSSYRTLAKVIVENPGEVLIDEVKVPGAGVLRVAWTAPSGTVVYSRGAGVAG